MPTRCTVEAPSERAIMSDATAEVGIRTAGSRGCRGAAGRSCRCSHRSRPTGQLSLSVGHRAGRHSRTWICVGSRRWRHAGNSSNGSLMARYGRCRARRRSSRSERAAARRGADARFEVMTKVRNRGPGGPQADSIELRAVGLHPGLYPGARVKYRASNPGSV